MHKVTKLFYAISQLIKKIAKSFGVHSKIYTFAPEFIAQVAELVDALDSKSSVLNRRAGSIPALSTKGEESGLS